MHLHNSFLIFYLLIATCVSLKSISLAHAIHLQPLTVTGSEEDNIEIDSINADGSMNLHGRTVEVGNSAIHDIPAKISASSLEGICG